MIGLWGIVVTTAASWYLAGLSWTVLLVVYPAFTRVGRREWDVYHAAHVRDIVPAVGWMWAAEALGVVLWIAAPPPGTTVLLALCATAVLATVVLTALAAVPAHGTLAAKYDAAAWRRLQRAHALRTAAWTIAAASATIAAALRLITAA